ncbi:MAG: cyclic nucleotide-binding domain-containing protein [Polyangiaceae bacterium]|nr:cyclic nucleotide-binding domain-containing protein [Polyangiaceae bacterium]
MTTGRRLPVAPLALAFLCVGAGGLGTIAGDTLFVSAFSLGELSRFVGISSLVRVGAAFAYAAVAERLLGADPPPARAARFDAAIVLLTAATFIAAAIGASSSDKAVLYAVCLALLVFPPLLPLIAFNTAASSLQARDAKRVLPLVAAAATVGAIAAAGAAGLLAKTVGVPWILVLATGVGLTAAPLLGKVAAADVTAPTPSRRPVKPEQAPSLLASLRGAAGDARGTGAVRVVLGFAFFGGVATTLADYAFKAALKGSTDREGVAAALGLFGVISNAVVLLLQLVVTGPLVARLGVGRTLAAFPTVLGAASVAAFALPPIVGTGLARLAETIVRYGVGNSVADVLLVPLARAVRLRAKVLVKGAASPLGALAGGAALAAFGENGPPSAAQLWMLTGACALLLWSVRKAPKAYAEALTEALAKGRDGLDVSPEAALVFRSALRRQLTLGVAAGDEADVRRTLELMSERWFSLDDVRPALAARQPEIRRLALEAATRLGGAAPEALLSMVPPDDDPEVELRALSTARALGSLASPARLERDIAIAERVGGSEVHARLWAEAVLHEALGGRAELDAGAREGQGRLDRALKRLRKEAREGATARRIAALEAIGELGDRRAEREVQLSLASSDARVFKAAAEAAIRLEASGVVAGLVARLVAGPHPAVAARALALAGPRAVRELIMALPVTRGEGAIAPTAVADGRTVSGTVRAARALARIGESASREVLPLFGELGHRARVAVARAFAAQGLRADGAERKLVEEAIQKLVAYGRAMLVHRRAHPSGLSAWGISRRLHETLEAIFDLASTVGDARALQRGKAFVAAKGPGRENALELIETVLPAPLGPEAARFVADATSEAPELPEGEPPPLDGWLEKCRKYDARELPSSDPMATVLDRVLVLRDVPLFGALSGEDLYPVAEIAVFELVEPDVDVVKQGEPSDDLYVVVEGELSVVKDGGEVGRLGPSKTFGELGVLDGEPRAATVRSLAPCRLLRIPRSELEALLDESPELAKGIIVTLLGYVRGGLGPGNKAGQQDQPTHPR